MAEIESAAALVRMIQDHQRAWNCKPAGPAHACAHPIEWAEQWGEARHEAGRLEMCKELLVKAGQILDAPAPELEVRVPNLNPPDHACKGRFCPDPAHYQPEQPSSLVEPTSLATRIMLVHEDPDIGHPRTELLADGMLAEAVDALTADRKTTFDELNRLGIKGDSLEKAVDAEVERLQDRLDILEARKEATS